MNDYFELYEEGYQVGYDAYWIGLSDRANPYDPIKQGDQWDGWNAGWQDAFGSDDLVYTGVYH